MAPLRSPRLTYSTALIGLIMLGCSPEAATSAEDPLEVDPAADTDASAWADDEGSTGDDAGSTGGDLEPDDSFDLSNSIDPAESGTRMIPVRFIVLTACAGCDAPDDADETTLRASLARANEAFEPEGFKFWVKSIERIPMFDFYNSGVTVDAPPVAWSQIRDQVRLAFPDLPLNAYLDEDAKSPHQWLNLAAALYGERDVMHVFIQRGSESSSATLPERGAMVRMVAQSIREPDSVTGQDEPTSIMAHEFGHYFGVRHTFDSLAGTNPVTGFAWTYADEWDQLWCETGFGPVFFESRTDYLNTQCQLFGTLRRIDRDADCGAPTPWSSFRCVIQGETFYADDPEISGIAQDRGLHQPPASYGAAVNTMGYFSRWDDLPFSTPVFHSASASDKIALYAAFASDYANDVVNAWRNGNGLLPPGTTAADYDSPHPELGTSDEDFTWFSNGDLSFASMSYPTSSAIQSAVAGDFNGDGFGDIVLYDGNSTLTIRWGLANRAYTTTAQGVPGTGFQLVAGDFDDDGRDDLFLYRPGGASDHWMFGNGGFNFALQTSGVSGTYTPVAGNFDGQHGDDIAWYAPASGTVHIWYSTGIRGQATHVNNVSIGANARIAVGDFNGNGRDDILLHRPGGASDQIRYGNSTQGSFTLRTISNVFGTYEPVVGDFNGDGRADVLWEAPNSTYDSIWPGGQRVPFGASHATTLYGAFDSAVADIDGDGVDDIFWLRD